MYERKENKYYVYPNSNIDTVGISDSAVDQRKSLKCNRSYCRATGPGLDVSVQLRRPVSLVVILLVYTRP